MEEGRQIIDKSFLALAQELQHDLDERSKRRVFSEGRGPKSLEEAYKLQRALRSVREARGEKVIGFKVGYTSKGVRENLEDIMGLTESVHGYLWDSESYKNTAVVDHRRLAIEGELGVKLLSADSDDVSKWEVEYEPIIEIHMAGMDGPKEDDLGRRGLELIGTNCIHAGVVHSTNTKRCLIGEISLNEMMTVSVGNEKIEQVTLSELRVGEMLGPVATLSWLLKTLKSEGNKEEALLREGAFVICSTPGALHLVPPGSEVRVEFSGLETSCSAAT